MKRLKIAITGCMGKMGLELIKSANRNKNIEIVALTENKITKKQKIGSLFVKQNSVEAFKTASIIIDFTTPACTIEVLKIANKLKKKVIIGTTGFNTKQEKYIKKISKKIPVLKAGNMSLGVNLLVYITEIVSKYLDTSFLSRVLDEHHKYKKIFPSGTAIMLGEAIAKGKSKNLKKLMGKKITSKNNVFKMIRNKKSYYLPSKNKINFLSTKSGETIGNHSVIMTDKKETINLMHEAHDRSLYSEGAIKAAMWLKTKKPGLYSMRNVLNFD
ncbi:MAG: 4-hydroxy-tetrahydrodipicolinate reductase [Candidatus Pelagibacter sp. TMED64]|nr:4-hydroxy-tetrahydrodipicolinate reductase [Candidatus Pelagibacter sp.]OUU65516.1 MAG: 4-hydroxy-tetrahydrodipicolinate reductase [Candidatus Pelagibacter sp. TMED64]|tara:strand:- start:554 stop:1369 length:816 start_codon:yes stop_codon:yes gene_type:complete